MCCHSIPFRALKTKPKILLIEDNEANRYLVTYLLQAHGFDVAVARDGASGIRIAKECKPRLILLDIQLPEMNGYDIARNLRSIEETMSIPIVAVTSYAMVGDREKAIEAGCNGYIEKPINPDTFIDEINSFLSQIPAPES